MALTSTPCEQSARLQPSTASCMPVQHGGVMLTKEIGPGLADSCEDCSRLVSPARQTQTSTPQSAQPNSNCSTGSNPRNFTYCGHNFLPYRNISTLCGVGFIDSCLRVKRTKTLFPESC